MHKTVGAVHGNVVGMTDSTDIAANIVQQTGFGSGDTLCVQGTASQVLDFISDIEYLVGGMKRALLDTMETRRRHAAQGGAR